LANRRRGHRVRGIALSWVGATAATVGGYLGGHLAFAAGDTSAAEPSAFEEAGIVDPQGAMMSEMSQTGELGGDVVEGLTSPATLGAPRG